MRRLVSVACAAALLGGCGPSLSSLVRERHYREAVCAAHDGSDDDKGAVARALGADAGLYVHVYVVPKEELRAILGDATDNVSARAQFARVRVQSNKLPLDDIALDAFITAPGGEIAGAPVRWDTLALATSETLPPTRTERRETYVTGANLLKAGGAVLTMGLSMLFMDFTPETFEVDVTHEDYPRALPLAAALRGSMPPSGCQRLGGGGAPGSSDGVGQRCDFYLVVETLADMSGTLNIRARYVAMREKLREYESPEEEKERRCVVEGVSRVPLGPLHEIGEATKKIFGPEMRPVAEVTSGP